MKSEFNYRFGRLISDASFNEIGKVVDKQKTEPTCFFQLGNPNAGKRVAISMRDTGECNVMLPVINGLLRKSDFKITVFADGPGAELLDRQIEATKLDIGKDILVEIADVVDAADVVLVSESADSGVEMSLAATAATKAKDKAIVVAIEDYPGAVCIQDGGLLKNRSPLLIPDWQCVTNNWSKDYFLRQRPDFNPDKILVTGSPAFDNIDKNKKIEEKKKFRKKYKVSDKDKVIVWMGQYGEADSETLRSFVAGLEESGISDFRIVIRRHPRDERSDVFFQNISSKFVDHLIDTVEESTDEARMAADVVVTMTSTEGIKSVIEQTLTLSIMIPEFLKLSGYDKLPYLISLDGSAAVARKVSEIPNQIIKITSDSEFQNGLRGKMRQWKVDNFATKRIITLVNKLTQK